MQMFVTHQLLASVFCYQLTNICIENIFFYSNEFKRWKICAVGINRKIAAWIKEL